jgi:hypothetical protein
MPSRAFDAGDEIIRLLKLILVAARTRWILLLTGRLDSFILGADLHSKQTLILEILVGSPAPSQRIPMPCVDPPAPFLSAPPWQIIFTREKAHSECGNQFAVSGVHRTVPPLDDVAERNLLFWKLAEKLCLQQYFWNHSTKLPTKILYAISKFDSSSIIMVLSME